MKGREVFTNKWNISVVICDTDTKCIHNGQPIHGGDRKILNVVEVLLNTKN
jgi:hypothetical protein